MAKKKKFSFKKLSKGLTSFGKSNRQKRLKNLFVVGGGKLPRY